MGNDSPLTAFDSDESLSKAEVDDAEEFAAINTFCRSLLWAIIALWIVFVGCVAYLAAAHASV